MRRESGVDYKAAGVDAYNAIQAHMEKRMSHGIQVGASCPPTLTRWTSRAGLGFSTNGNKPGLPLDLRSGYGSADFDRTHVITFNYTSPYRPEVLCGQQHSLEGEIVRWLVAGRAHRVAERAAI